MKTFQEFIEIAEETKKTLKDILGPGVPSERPTNLSSLNRRSSTSTSDYTPPIQPSRSGVIRPLNQATYQGRVGAGRNSRDRTKRKEADNPDFQGPIKGAGSGTRDRMPGTSPSSSPTLPPKMIAPRPLGTNLAKPTSKPTGPIKPKGTGNWV